MKKTTLTMLVCLLLGGCADSAKEVQPANSKSPSAKSTEPASNTKSVDAEVLPASTLEQAKLLDKHVLLHLGAPG